jgi:hypothetical protein
LCHVCFNLYHLLEILLFHGISLLSTFLLQDGSTDTLVHKGWKVQTIDWHLLMKLRYDAGLTEINNASRHFKSARKSQDCGFPVMVANQVPSSLTSQAQSIPDRDRVARDEQCDLDTGIQ